MVLHDAGSRWAFALGSDETGTVPEEGRIIKIASGDPAWKLIVPHAVVA